MYPPICLLILTSLYGNWVHPGIISHPSTSNHSVSVVGRNCVPYSNCLYLWFLLCESRRILFGDVILNFMEFLAFYLSSYMHKRGRFRKCRVFVYPFLIRQFLPRIGELHHVK